MVVEEVDVVEAVEVEEAELRIPSGPTSMTTMGLWIENRVTEGAPGELPEVRVRGTEDDLGGRGGTGGAVCETDGPM